MSLFSTRVKAEYERNLKEQLDYERVIARLPRGSLASKIVRKTKTYRYAYWYLVYRHNGKVVSKYVSDKQNSIYELMQQIKYRRVLQSELRELKKEQRALERFLRLTKSTPQ